jgi:hypothetical protein
VHPIQNWKFERTAVELLNNFKMLYNWKELLLILSYLSCQERKTSWCCLKIVYCMVWMYELLSIDVGPLCRAMLCFGNCVTGVDVDMSPTWYPKIMTEHQIGLATSSRVTTVVCFLDIFGQPDAHLVGFDVQRFGAPIGMWMSESCWPLQDPSFGSPLARLDTALDAVWIGCGKPKCTLDRWGRKRGSNISAKISSNTNTEATFRYNHQIWNKWLDCKSNWE